MSILQHTYINNEIFQYKPFIWQSFLHQQLLSAIEFLPDFDTCRENQEGKCVCLEFYRKTQPLVVHRHESISSFFGNGARGLTKYSGFTAECWSIQLPPTELQNLFP